MTDHKPGISVWTKLGDVLHHATGAFVAVVDHVRKIFEGDPHTRRQVAFSVAMIALSAKMAKADGVVSDSEVTAFYEIFQVPPEDCANVERLYNLAKGDVAGFDHYAARIARLCRDEDCDGGLLEDVLDGLFHIAKADGVIHDDELAYLQTVSSIFGFSETRFEAISSRHIGSADKDPWAILGLARGVTFSEARNRYLELVREHHPDKLAARGLPNEFSAIANERLATINMAWAMIRKELKSV